VSLKKRSEIINYLVLMDEKELEAILTYAQSLIGSRDMRPQGKEG